MSVRALFAGTLAVAAGCTLQPDDVATSARVDYWRPSVSGIVSITKASKLGTATDVSLRRDAGLDDGNALAAGLDFDVGRNRVSFEYMDLALNGSTVAPEDFIFHGQTFPQGDFVSTELNCPTGRLSWSYAFWQRDQSSWWAGLGARIWTFDMKMTNDTTGATTSRTFSHVFPMAITDASFDLGDGFSTVLRGNVAALSTPQVVYDAAAGLGYHYERFRGELGWRFVRYDFNESTNDGDFNLTGPFVSLRFSF
jgi:hypothetical protein